MSVEQVTSPRSVQDAVRGLWRALSDRDWDGVRAHVSDDCIYLDVPVGPTAAAKGGEDIVKRLKIGLAPLASYENFDGLLIADGPHVMYEHHEEWHWETGESAVLRFVSVHRVEERHRHRYEVNNAYRDRISESGLKFSGTSPDGQLVEFVEYDADLHPFLVGTQAHPELKSRPTRPHPLFASFVGAALDYKAAERLPLEEIDSEVHGAGSHAEGSDDDAEQLQESRG